MVVLLEVDTIPQADKCTTIHGRPRSIIINLTRSSIILEAAIINQCSHTQEANHTRITMGIILLVQTMGQNIASQ